MNLNITKIILPLDQDFIVLWLLSYTGLSNKSVYTLTISIIKFLFQHSIWNGCKVSISTHSIWNGCPIYYQLFFIKMIDVMESLQYKNFNFNYIFLSFYYIALFAFRTKRKSYYTFLIIFWYLALPKFYHLWFFILNFRINLFVCIIV